MAYLTEQLGLDEVRVRRQRDALRGLGAAYTFKAEEFYKKEQAGTEQLWLLAAASNYRRAGANSVLIGDTNEARNQFSQSAKIYKRLKMLYGSFILNLGNDADADQPVNFRHDKSDIFGLWSQGEINLTDQPRNIRVSLEAYRSTSVGSMGFEIGSYLDLFDAVSSWEKGSYRAVEALLPFLAAYSVALKRAQADKYHWSRLAMPFHPAEPDILALLVSTNRQLRLRGGSIGLLLERLPIGREVISLLKDLLNQLKAW